jgi:hypothetical protein
MGHPQRQKQSRSRIKATRKAIANLKFQISEERQRQRTEEIRARAGCLADDLFTSGCKSINLETRDGTQAFTYQGLNHQTLKPGEKGSPTKPSRRRALWPTGSSSTRRARKSPAGSPSTALPFSVRASRTSRRYMTGDCPAELFLGVGGAVPIPGFREAFFEVD